MTSPKPAYASSFLYDKTITDPETAITVSVWVWGADDDVQIRISSGSLNIPLALGIETARKLSDMLLGACNARNRAADAVAESE